MVTTAFSETLTMNELRKQVRGTVLTPNHPGYDQVRRGWNLSIDQYPALIVVAADAADVAAGVRFARDNGLGVAVQSTGHGIMQPADDALLIVTSRMNAVHVNADAQTAWVEAGAIWKQVLDAAQPVGLAPLLGSTPYVGVVGYTLGGGMGWLARKYGLAADSVRSIEVVTPDGRLRRASATENADLFWGLRGGGGNFGVVTALEIDLYPVKVVYGGELMYPIELLPEALSFFRDWTAKVPEEMTAWLVTLQFPPIPEVPEHLRGRKVLFIKMAFSGAPEWGKLLADEWREWVTPISDTVRVMPFSEIGTIADDPVNPMPIYVTGELIDVLSDEAIGLLTETLSQENSPLIFSELRHGGGAIAKADRSANAIGNRDTAYYFMMAGATPTPEAQEQVEQFIAQFKRDLRPHISGGVYLNFMEGAEADERTKDAYSAETYRRLMTLKAKYDPNNLFRYSFSIPVAEVELV